MSRRGIEGPFDVKGVSKGVLTFADRRIKWRVI
jgi:hypothetical protein